MPRSVHYNILANDPETASRFYADTFGWEMRRDAAGGYTFICDTDCNQCHGDVRRGQLEECQTVTVRVPSVEASIERVVRAGGKVIIPKKTIPDVGYMAYCEDPEGHVFGLFSPDIKAQ